jgi:hypothetical protein
VSERGDRIVDGAHQAFEEINSHLALLFTRRALQPSAATSPLSRICATF